MPVRRVLMVMVLAAVVALPSAAYAAFQYPGTSTYSPYPPSVNHPPPAAAQKPATNPFGLVAPTYVPPGVSETGVFTTPITPASKGATATYNLDWTIGSNGKSGCLVCHGDKNLTRVEGGVVVSLYVDTAQLASSAHAKLLCTDCHTDFAFKTPHPSAQNNTWQAVAKSSCKNCHQPEYLDWGKSAHSTAGSVGVTSTVGAANSSAPGMPKPLCGDCHGGHDIPAKSDAAGMAAIHASADAMCGKCHAKATQTYDDYYHGAAYKQGAPDAPACWQCHNTHLILPSSNIDSWTNPDNLVQTCSQCHKGAGPGYVQYASLVHTRQAVVQNNPIMSAVDTATTAIRNMWRTVLSAFGRSSS